MTIKRFTKSCYGKIYIFFSVIFFIACALFITEGCEKSDYEKALNGEDIAADTQTIDTQPNNTTSGTTEKTTINEVTETNTTDSYTLKFAEKSLNIKALGAFHSSLNVWSAQLNINKSTGETSGYIFISYVEAALDGNSTEINTSVLKANLKGTIDMKTLDFKGWVTGNIAADRDDFFSGSIDIETTGKLSEDHLFVSV
ncbi:MAG: hypothetical protein ACXWFZ_14565 [Nitrososphaeraceae archaeon]